MWLTGRLAPDFKTIADFRKDNGAAIRAVCGQFVALCRGLKLFTRAIVAIDGSKFKAVNNRDKNYTVAKVTGRMEQVDASIARYLRALDQGDRGDFFGLHAFLMKSIDHSIIAMTPTRLARIEQAQLIEIV